MFPYHFIAFRSSFKTGWLRISRACVRVACVCVSVAGLEAQGHVETQSFNLVFGCLLKSPPRLIPSFILNSSVFVPRLLTPPPSTAPPPSSPFSYRYLSQLWARLPLFLYLRSSPVIPSIRSLGGAVTSSKLQVIVDFFSWHPGPSALRQVTCPLQLEAQKKIHMLVGFFSVIY